MYGLRFVAFHFFLLLNNVFRPREWSFTFHDRTRAKTNPPTHTYALNWNFKLTQKKKKQNSFIKSIFVITVRSIEDSGLQILNKKLSASSIRYRRRFLFFISFLVIWLKYRQKFFRFADFVIEFCSCYGLNLMLPRTVRINEITRQSCCK